MKLTKVVSVFTPEPGSNSFFVVEEKRGKVVLCSLFSIETYSCECGFETGYPFQMLLHLRDQHGLDEMAAMHVFVGREDDQSRTYFEFPKGKVPKEFSVLSDEEARITVVEELKKETEP